MQALGEDRFGVILAGGEGVRLRPLTRRIAGDERPKQFCPLLGGETLLERTRRRAALAIDPGRTLVVLTRAHERFYAPARAALPPECAVVQPENRGTSAAILYALARIAEATPLGAVAILPSDHYVSDDAGFMRHVAAAFEAVAAHPDLVVLLGVEPDAPEVEYGWIDPGDPLPARRGVEVRRVRRFVEKPSRLVAEALMARGCLWNSFVVVAWVPALLALFRSACPELARGFAAVRGRLRTISEEAAVSALYARLPASSFSRDVLAPRPEALAVLVVAGLVWSDWGQPDRVLATFARLGLEPGWAEPALPAELAPRRGALPPFEEPPGMRRGGKAAARSGTLAGEW